MLIYPTGTTAEDFKPGSYPDYGDASRYRTNQTRREVGAYLTKVKECVKTGCFVVSEDDGEGEGSRKENREFLNAYGLYSRSEQKKLLLSLDVDEFCHSRLTNDGRELYVFCPERELYKTMIGPKRIKVYIKNDYNESLCPYDTVISMHELNLPIDLLFID